MNGSGFTTDRMLSRIATYLQTLRLQTAMVTSAALWIGYASINIPDIKALAVLTLLGMLIHIWGFGLNEVQDAEYDSEKDESGSHPIAEGKVSKDIVKIIVNSSLILSIFLAAVIIEESFGYIAYTIMIITGYIYNKFSKQIWYSNFVLSAWAFAMTFIGASIAGAVTIYTFSFAVLLSAQIFVQVIQGDLKDINGSEETLAEKLGVEVNEQAISYSWKFNFVLYLFKFIIQLPLAVAIFWSNLVSPHGGGVVIFSVFTLLFIATAIRWPINELDRGKIKERSAQHEIISMAFIAWTIYPVSASVAVFMCLAPPVWYGFVNRIIYDNVLNPSI